MDPQIVAFAGLAAALTLTPGADTALVTKNALSHGREAAFFSSLGISTGVTFHAVASAAGLSAILGQSALAFAVVKLLGAAYLFFLGVQAIRGKGKTALPVAGSASAAAEGRRSRLLSYRQGLLTNVLNPKVALFYLTLLPQFISPGDPVLAKALLLASIHIGMGLAWLSTYAYFVSRLAELLTQPRVRRAMESVTGLLLIGLGLRLAWERQ